MEILFKPVGKSKSSLPILLIVVVVFLVYLPTLGSGFVWDDDMNIIGNLNFRGLSASHLYWMFTTFYDGNYHPLCWMTFGLDFVLWGLNPAGYHLSNLLLHIFNSILFYFLIVISLRQTNFSDSDTDLFGVQSSAFIGTLFFAIHPLRVESVAWISTRGDVLCGFFYLLAVIAYLKMAQEQETVCRRKFFLLSLIFFILSLLSRAWGMTFPLVLLILDVYPLRRFEWTGRFILSHKMLLIEKVPFVLFSLGAGILAFLAKKGYMLMVTEHGVFDRIVQAIYGLSFYIVKTILPFGLSPLYLLDKSFNPMEQRYILSAFLVLGITMGIIIMRHRWPWAIASWLCYTVIISPLLGLVQSGPQITADRYTYIACMPFGILVGAGMLRLWTARHKKILPSAGWLAVVTGVLVCLAVLSVLSLQQTRVWKDRGTFWSHVIQFDPDNYIAYNDRGSFYTDQGDPVRAMEDYKTAIRLKPDFTKVYYNRAILRQQIGNLSGAIADYSTVIRLNPNHAEAYNNRGSLFQSKGDMARALTDYDNAIRLNPYSPEPYANRGLIRQAQNDLKMAFRDFSSALEVASVDWQQRALVEQLLKNIRNRLEKEDKKPDFK